MRAYFMSIVIILFSVANKSFSVVLCYVNCAPAWQRRGQRRACRHSGVPWGIIFAYCLSLSRQTPEVWVVGVARRHVRPHTWMIRIQM